MPPMPPPGIAGIAGFSLGSSATMASVVTNKPADLDQDRDKMRACLGTLKDFPGVAGPITMDEHRDGTGITAILKVVNGKYENIAK